MTSPPGFAPASREFFTRDALELAPDLLGCYLEHTTDDGTVGLIITEMEAYTGERDPGSHAFRGQTARNSTMFGEAGHLYAYFTYGMHYAINVVAGEVGHPYGCLVRAGRVIEGADLARRRRTKPARVSALPERDLARGPGNLAQALGANLGNDGDDLIGGAWRLLVPDERPLDISTGPRVGVSGPGGDGDSFPWRYWITGDPTVSAYKPGAVRVRRTP